MDTNQKFIRLGLRNLKVLDGHCGGRSIGDSISSSHSVKIALNAKVV
jgi:hypothetical protein